ncbi:hypothetical protein KC363_g1692 [Hortaea werneckii]|uniref:separase n=1 Tax=Hortaea werneckii TaxID=91943 RepID=A0A3M7FL76_HORWE|nr:hypothetical protein KC363_g1692 [Hortaea werneckii]RMY89659.1 hypothetical protein D0861_04092 [Hortaea werneckii]
MKTTGTASPDAVKQALQTGCASTSTVSTLQRLLSPAPTATSSGAKSSTKLTGPGSRAANTRNGNVPPRKGSTKPAVSVREDPPLPPLTAKARCALATDVVNVSLKVLTEATKVSSTAKTGSARSRRQDSPTPQSDGRTEERSSNITQPLQPRSGNSTPVRKTSARQSEKPEEDSASRRLRNASQPTHLLAVAECASTGFSYLRSPEMADGSAGTPNTQLVAGMLALAARLVALNFHTLAVKELKAVKRQLEEPLKPAKGTMTTKSASSNSAKETKPTIASLLHLDSGLKDQSEALPLAITHQQLVLKIIAMSHKAAEVESAVEHVNPDSTSSPAAFIMQQAELTSNKAKAATQLEAHSQILLGLCPKLSSSNDSEALESSECVSPMAAFKLQVSAFRIRQEWWQLAGHQSNTEKELLEPFSRCLAALLRRCNGTSRTYREAQEALTSLRIDVISASGAAFGLCHNLMMLAEKDGDDESALQWSQKLMSTCEDLPQQNAKRMASLATNVSKLATSKERDLQHLRAQVEALEKRLRGQLSGSSADYDFLIVELARLSSILRQDRELIVQVPAARIVLIEAASFAQRYARSYPGRSDAQVQSIISSALRLSKGPEDVCKWATVDAVRLFVRLGALKSVTREASTKPLATAWAASTSSLGLGVLLHSQLLRALKSEKLRGDEWTYDEDTLDATERATMLEWQLNYALGLVERPKYRANLQSCISKLSNELSSKYTISEHPLRRVRAASYILQACGANPGLFPKQMVEDWLETPGLEIDRLGKDQGLSAYTKDIQSGFDVAKAFNTGTPKMEDFKPALLNWQTLIDLNGPTGTVSDCIDRIEMLAHFLCSIASYAQVMGDGAVYLPTLHMLLRLCQASGYSADVQVEATVGLSEQYLELGLAETAGSLLAKCDKLANKDAVSDLVMMRLLLAHATCLLSIDDTDAARDYVRRAGEHRSKLPPEQVARGDRRAYELAHAQCWLNQSTYCRETGALEEALGAAKSAVRLLSSAWAAIERSLSDDSCQSVAEVVTMEPDRTNHDAANGLVSGISKLQLKPLDDKAAKAPEKGAAFWVLAPPMCKALMCLSDLYAHHGLFGDANYYSERAVKIAESVGSKSITLRTRCQRARLLANAGRFDNASLCLEAVDQTEFRDHPILQIDLQRTKGILLCKENSLREAAHAYDYALQSVHRVQSTAPACNLERFESEEQTLAARTANLKIECESKADAADAKKKPSTRAARPKAPIKGRKPAAAASTSRATGGRGKTKAAPVEVPTAIPYLMNKLKRQLLLEKGLVVIQSGCDGEVISMIEDTASTITSTLQQRQLQFQHLMRKANETLESDISYNMLPESTLSFPAIVRQGRRPSSEGTSRPSLLPSPSKNSDGLVVAGKPPARSRQGAQGLTDLLLAARDCLIGTRSASLKFSSTAETHRECSMLSSTTLLLSAAGFSDSHSKLHPIREAMYLEQPKIHALECEQHAVFLDASCSTEPFSWPDNAVKPGKKSLSAAAFQEQYIDILPKPWTCVSLSLNNDCSELYVARYRAGQSPLIVRLPFSRRSPEDDDDDEEDFDYHKGKAELQDIIEASNYTCHNTNGGEAKAAKRNWWSEREALDKRLHELLINMENIWFGGFKGVFSQHARQPDLLARLRKSFDEILARYLPSRQAGKGRTTPLRLDDKVLELFVGLGDDQDGLVDLDEQLADLLYFVVDMLQFGGEQNAYDEIDFDSMAVDVLDALRSYHEATAEQVAADAHLILILDKRLQAFPWESMPCLENASSTNAEHGSYAINRASGTYILNPSKDLKSTQNMLSAPLAKLAGAGQAQWTSMVQKAPSEEEFAKSLTERSMLLYFGHGSGAQYIRPRTIRKLDACSQVVWLMGCSSGSVSEHGELEPSAVPLAYLMAGNKRAAVHEDNEGNEQREEGSKCMAVLATLWDVTDKDIDRFSTAVGEEWGLWPAAEEAPKMESKAPKEKRQLDAPATPQQAPKTPKTPRVRKTPAAVKTPARSRSRPRREVERKKSLVDAVARSRDACYLRYLNGAAPVVYGVPVYLGD